jgi:hypothetical protein
MTANLPYRLAYRQGWIYAQGQSDLLKSLATIPSAFPFQSDPGAPCGSLAFPASRATFLAAEAMAAPVSVSQDYKAARQQTLGVPLQYQAEVDQTLSHLSPLARDLKNHQAEFCALAWRQRGMINASEQGTGKTTMAWATAALWGAKRVLIVAGNSFVQQWQDEWEALWQSPRPFGCTVLGSGTGTIERRGERITALGANPHAWPVTVVTNYEAIATIGRKEHRRLGLEDAIRAYHPDCVILDESWNVKNPESAITKALIPICDAAQHVLCLTGTPVGNHVGDLWAQLRMLGPQAAPEDFWDFTARFANLIRVNIGTRQVIKPQGVRDVVGLMLRIEPFWYRATKEVCLELPPKRRWPVVRVDLPAEQQALYERVEDEGECALGNTLALSTSRVVAVRLHQIAGGFRPVYSPARQGVDPDCCFQEAEEWYPEDRPAGQRASYAMEPQPCYKLEWLKRFAREVLVGDPTRRLIIWVRYLHELRRLVNELLPYVDVEGVSGDTPNEYLGSLKTSFNSRAEDGVQVLVCQWQKMAFGHNLQSADWHVRFSGTWSYVQHSQAEDRSHRMGREEEVNYIDLIARGTIDEDILRAINEKRDFASHLGGATVSSA